MRIRFSRVYFSLFLLFVILFGAAMVKWSIIPRISSTETYDLHDKTSLEMQLKAGKERIVALESLVKKQTSGDTATKSLTDQLKQATEEIEQLKANLNKHKQLNENALPLINRDLDRKLNLSEIGKSIVDQVTFVLFSLKESNLCLKGRLETIKQNYPGAHIVVISSAKISEKPSSAKIEYVSPVQQEGKALGVLESKVKTKYFLYLSTGVSISPHNSNQSISWLYHALENVPEVDFVGGAVLKHELKVKYPVYEAPCHRLRLCNWTFSQTFEYRYSIGDMMICEETSASFMGRITSLQKIGHFDKNLDVMATTDFFLRAKGKAVVGLRPEVFFLVSQTCAQSPPDELKMQFMIKHKVYVLKDSLGREVRAEKLKNFDLIKGDIKHWQHNTFAKPHFLEGLKFNLETGADYLEQQNITYYIDGGVALGAVKVRGILPWDSGDIDLVYVAPWREVKRGLEDYCKKKGIVKAKVTTASMGGDKQELLLWAAGDDNFGVNTMFEEGQAKANQELYMYIYIHGRRYPVLRQLFQYFRQYYGTHYLQMHGYHSDKGMKCGIPGHHACVPAEFSTGPGGHWRDFYCQI